MRKCSPPPSFFFAPLTLFPPSFLAISTKSPARTREQTPPFRFKEGKAWRCSHAYEKGFGEVVPFTPVVCNIIIKTTKSRMYGVKIIPSQAMRHILAGLQGWP